MNQWEPLLRQCRHWPWVSAANRLSPSINHPPAGSRTAGRQDLALYHICETISAKPSFSSRWSNTETRWNDKQSYKRPRWVLRSRLGNWQQLVASPPCYFLFNDRSVLKQMLTLLKACDLARWRWQLISTLQLSLDSPLASVLPSELGTHTALNSGGPNNL